MKKGDLRKQEILQTAEQLFCRKGYGQTGIQDILDQLNTSKGSFYHHFVSKEALLTTLCAKRAEQSRENALSIAECKKNATEKLDCLLTSMIPLHDEKLSFILMLLPTFILPEGRSVKTCFCDSLTETYHPAVRDAIREGVLSGEMICNDPEIFADIMISLVNRLWVSVCDSIIENETKGMQADLSELLHLTEQYRTAAERILSLPYGSLMLIGISELKELMDQIHVHWKTEQN